MTGAFPQPGQVFSYHYLWKWQQDAGETEGRKPRPSCVTVVVRNQSGQTVMFIAPITSKDPGPERAALSIPQIEAGRANLETSLPLWVMVDELNVDVLETSFTLESRTPLGSFGPGFTTKIVEAIQTVRQSRKLDLAKRT